MILGRQNERVILEERLNEAEQGAEVDVQSAILFFRKYSS